MTAVDVDALDAAPLLVRVRVNRPGEPERWVVGAISKTDPAIAPLLAEVRRGRALREAVEELAEGAASAADLPVLKGDRFDAGVAATYRSYADRLRELLAAVDPS